MPRCIFDGVYKTIRLVQSISRRKKHSKQGNKGGQLQCKKKTLKFRSLDPVDYTFKRWLPYNFGGKRDSEDVSLD